MEEILRKDKQILFDDRKPNLVIFLRDSIQFFDCHNIKGKKKIFLHSQKILLKLKSIKIKGDKRRKKRWPRLYNIYRECETHIFCIFLNTKLSVLFHSGDGRTNSNKKKHIL